MPHVTLYTDGSWKKSYQAGGWACLMVCGPYWKLVANGEPEITINRAELTAVLVGLESLTEPCSVTVYSDSSYTVNAINKWIAAWEQNGWKTVSKDPVANQDILMRLREQMYRHQVVAHWIKAHTNRKGLHYLGNACVDTFAQLGSEGRLNGQPIE